MLDRLVRISREQHLSLRGAALIAAALLIVSLRAVPALGQAPAQTSLGVIDGVVIYQADSKRPWRYQRYYVKDRKQGLLAEAVVALGGTKFTGAEARAPQTAAIDQKDHRFTPETIAIAAGDKVNFTNSDSFVHNVYSSTPLAVFDATMGPGGTHGQEFRRALGIRRPVEIGCKLHSQMKAWVFVFDHPYFALTGQDGGFRLENVPPGEYELEMHHPAGQLRSKQKVQVRAGETTKIEIRVSPENRST